MIKQFLVLAGLVIGLQVAPVLSAEPGAIAQPADKTTDKKVVFPLAQAIKQPISKYTLDELAKMWPAFRHASIETAGFNHFTLPFHYTSRDGSGDSNEAYAFSFLLSNSLDWAPGCYCARHAYFTFKRARKDMQKLAKKYDEDLIKFTVKDWQATHAVGGKLIQSKDGYAGTLEIYDRSGKNVLEKKYKKPREFFDLLGDMSVDAIDFFGGKPSPALVRHLHLKRCKHHQSIIDLGKAAFLKERSKEEFRLYEQILKRDPGFADVRYWWANQKWWQDGNRGHYMRQTGLALSSYLVEAAVWDFNPLQCPDRKLARKHNEWIRQAEQLVGPDRPKQLQIKLESATKARRISPELLVRATKVASKNPNDYWLLYYLGKTYFYGNGLDANSDMAASIQLTALRNRYLTGSGGKGYVAVEFARAVKDIGYNDICAQIAIPLATSTLRESGAKKAAWQARIAAESLEKMGRHAEAVAFYKIAFRGWEKNDKDRNQMLVAGGIAAAIAGKGDVVAQILRDRAKDLADAKMTFLLKAYSDALAGKPINTKAVYKESRHGSSWGYMRQVEFCTQIDLMSGRNFHRKDLAYFLRASPNNRSLWILFDAYDRRNPRPNSASFYEAVEWLHGDDPWVKKAVADYRRRAKKTKVLSADDLLKRMRRFKPVRRPARNPSTSKSAKRILQSLPPGTVAAAIRRLVGKGEFDKAEELAMRFNHVAIQRNGYWLRLHCNHLVHLVEQACEKASRLKAKKNRPGL